MRITIVTTVLLCATSAAAQVNIRVVDTGQALCVVARMPPDHVMIYDAGTSGACYDGIRAVVPEGSRVDLLVLSHTDADHVGAVVKIMDGYDVRRVLRTGRARSTPTWCKADIAIAGEMEEYEFGDTEYNQALDHCRSNGEPAAWLHLMPVNSRSDINLATTDLAPGATWRFGDAFVTFVTGHQDPPYPGLNEAESNNAGSIILKLTYRGRSVMFTGDAVGRHKDQVTDTCIATEAEALEIARDWPIGLSLDADVLIAPHHGGDNGSCTDFVRAVSPESVIVSAGRRHEHPDADAIGRYITQGIPPARILRTDRGDDEGGEEWDYLRVAGCSDRAGDDHLQIVLEADGSYSAAYETAHDLGALRCRQ